MWNRTPEDKSKLQIATKSRQKNANIVHAAIGDIVAVVETSSTVQTPVIILGKVLRVFPKEQEVLLAWLRPHGKKVYRLVVGSDSWKEPWSSLIHPIDVSFNDKTNFYTLRTPTVELHNFINT